MFAKEIECFLTSFMMFLSLFTLEKKKIFFKGLKVGKN
jgi:hypothetical protein